MRAINWKMIFAATVLSLSAAGFANTALAEGRDPVEKAGYEATIRSASEANANGRTGAPLIEGRNAYVQQPSTQNVEPYIQRSIEQNARSTR
ncbi:hypothetical protein KHC23_22275 [Ancylobacter dichloromethanicus]|uniref:DUF4148 domain-containing protein n=1 Tax=Ancylobacter dichloromethanicus TaxID=518825 RepID=A0A9W6J5J3_9HYPH|nr:hypothetical protein [Ancylobacter dichloromethanicus]MBS7556363.1 hypothetical protein [Ancylobacter dichloromethanicus]GLK70128.1 hypothetical protein GCM10017643_02430 [Ancylobacter dichloromethanicus]